MTAFSAERRRMLLTVLGLAPAAATLSAEGCAPAPPRGEAPLRVPLASLPEGRRVRVMMGDRPVELVRAGDGVTARSLWCTHMGCEVGWSADRSRYLCPCHGGEFDERGVPLNGPPKAPLRVLTVAVVGDVAVVRPPEGAR
ncbi:MAG: Rieske (2Fe-2S) protein [Candidatus Eisenbacteria bacterium]